MPRKKRTLEELERDGSQLASKKRAEARRAQIKALADAVTAAPRTPAPRTEEEWRPLLGLLPGFDSYALGIPSGCHFDADAAADAVDWIEDNVVLIKGERAGSHIRLEPWQRGFIGCLFGWKREDGTRRFREALLYIPRKNGKSTLAAAIALYVFFEDGEPGAEVYCAAAKRDQARLVWDLARRQILRKPELSKRARVMQYVVLLEESASSFKAISSDAKTEHGLDIHAAFIDELHAQPNSELLDAILTATGARRQPLVVEITTAAVEGESVCNSKHAYAKEVRDNPGDKSKRGYDPWFLPAIYEASREDDWTKEETWRKANPCLGISLSIDYIRTACEKAKADPTFTQTFRQLHLNTRVESTERWLDMELWRACGEPFDPKILLGRPCYAGLDVASTDDITALVLYFHETHHVLAWFWVPRDRAHDRSKRNDPYYLRWADSGHLRLTPGNQLDEDLVKKEMLEILMRYRAVKIGFDKYNAFRFTQSMQAIGLEPVSVGQGWVSQMEPMKYMSATLLGKKLLRHGSNPVLDWMAANAKLERVGQGNFHLAKPAGYLKVDGIAALIDALALVITLPAVKTSIYETRGPLVFS